MIINDYKYMYTCMYVYMHVYLAPSYISFPLCIARISREQIISHQNLTRLKCPFLFKKFELVAFFFFRCYHSCQGDGGVRGVGLWGRFARPAFPPPEKLHRAIQEKGHL